MPLLLAASDHYPFAVDFPDGSVVENMPAKVGDTGHSSLIPGDPLEEEMATHSSILAWEIP